MLTQDSIRGITIPRLDAILKDFLDDLDKNPISFPERHIFVDFIIKHYRIVRGVELKYSSDDYDWRTKKFSYKFKVITV